MKALHLVVVGMLFCCFLLGSSLTTMVFLANPEWVGGGASYVGGAKGYETHTVLKTKRLEIVDNDDQLRGLMTVLENGSTQLALTDNGSNKLMLIVAKDFSAIQVQCDERMSMTMANKEGVHTFHLNGDKETWATPK